MKYDNLIFDLYGTLVDIRTVESAAVWEKTAIYFGFYGASYEAEELKDTYRKILTCKNRDAGQSYECFPELQIETIFSELFERKGIVQDAALLGYHAAQFFRILSIEYLRLYPGVKEALAQLRKDGHRLWLFSNAQRVFTAYEIRFLGLEHFFDGIYLSSDYGCRKPDIRFFHQLLQEQVLKPNDCLMIGNDLAADIAGAKSAGLHTFYIHSNISPKEDEKAERIADYNYNMETTDWIELLKELRTICF